MTGPWPGPTSSTSISAMQVSPGLRMFDTHQPRWGGWLSLRVTSTRPGGPSIRVPSTLRITPASRPRLTSSTSAWTVPSAVPMIVLGP